MHDPAANQQAPRHIPFKQEGWGTALFVVLLAVATAAGAYYVHKSTYVPPTDVRFRAIGASAATHE
jgi:hypothetical protein